jgi:CMP-N,N'-diacetyllegionaminic acid synthase
MREKKIVAVVPARSGSTGLPNKNILDLGGKPMFAHSVEPALGSSYIQDVYLNSDSDEYLDLGKAHGALPYKRDAHLANVSASVLPVVADFLATMEKEGTRCDAALVLYPTYPFRSSEQIDDIIRFYLDHPGCSSVVGLKNPDTHPYLCLNKDAENGISTVLPYDVNQYYRRQDYPVFYEFTTWALMVSFTEIDQLNAQMFNENTKGYVVPDGAITLDIDVAEDYEYAQYLIASGRGNAG